jgi:isopropylmalate/homocitrate/citramalate synthase
MERIRIYDTTLRDGMQAEGISFSLEDKLAIAKHLDALDFDYIEGGYASSNDKEMQFFLEAAKLKLRPRQSQASQHPAARSTVRMIFHQRDTCCKPRRETRTEGNSGIALTEVCGAVLKRKY